MKVLFSLVITVAACFLVLQAATTEASHPVPQYDKNGRLMRPEGYREWVFLSSGLGMSYSQQAGGHPMFTNVFAPQWAYKTFVETGSWPDKTTFVVEERDSQTKGSINKVGNFQTDLMGMGVEVKDSGQPDKWAYFSFDEGQKTTQVNPKQACFQCHEDHAAVEHSFVQFYPTLKAVARKFGVYNQSRENPAN
jgi:hypothetical protein